MKWVEAICSFGAYPPSNSLKHLKRFFFLSKILLKVENREISCLPPASADAERENDDLFALPSPQWILVSAADSQSVKYGKSSVLKPRFFSPGGSCAFPLQPFMQCPELGGPCFCLLSPSLVLAVSPLRVSGAGPSGSAWDTLDMPNPDLHGYSVTPLLLWSPLLNGLPFPLFSESILQFFTASDRAPWSHQDAIHSVPHSSSVSYLELLSGFTDTYFQVTHNCLLALWVSN